MDPLCTIDEQRLLDYVIGLASADLAAQIEQAPACRQAAHQLAVELEPLLALLYRLSCPTEERLVAYQERRLMGTEQLVLHRHVQECPHCQAEVSLLAEVDAVPLAPTPGLLRRLVEALFVPPTQLPQAVRGTLLRYQTPQVMITINARKMADRSRAWTVSGQLRTHEGLLFTTVEQIILRTLDHPQFFERTTTLSNTSTFTFRELPPGSYTLLIITPDQEILIREIVISEDQ